MGITQAEFARQQRVSRARVSQWVASGVIILDKDGLIDPIEAADSLDRNLDQGRRIDYECTFKERGSSCKGPPAPFTGNVVRDFSLMTIQALYNYLIAQLGPVQLRFLQEAGHFSMDAARKSTILLCFKIHEIIKNFVEDDILSSLLRENGEDTDDFSAQLLRKRRQKTHPPRDFGMLHPHFLLKLLKEEKKSKDPLFEDHPEREKRQS